MKSPFLAVAGCLGCKVYLNFAPLPAVLSSVQCMYFKVLGASTDERATDGDGMHLLKLCYLEQKSLTDNAT